MRSRQQLNQRQNQTMPGHEEHVTRDSREGVDGPGAVPDEAALDEAHPEEARPHVAEVPAHQRLTRAKTIVSGRRRAEQQRKQSSQARQRATSERASRASSKRMNRHDCERWRTGNPYPVASRHGTMYLCWKRTTAHRGGTHDRNQ